MFPTSSRSPRSLREGWPALLGLSAVFLVEMLDNSILNVALPTIGRELHASATSLQWVTGSYAVVFGSLMLFFGAVADRFGRRRIMLTGLVMLGLASLATGFVTNTAELTAVRAAMGVAAAMTTPGSMALAFRLFADDALRVRAMTLISTVGLVGLAVGPTVGGLVLAVAPWQVLLLVNAPIAVVALAGVRFGIAADHDLHRAPLDLAGAALATTTIVAALVAPTLFVSGTPLAWVVLAAAVVGAGLFLLRERSARHPLLDLALVAHPLVAGGLAFKAAAGLATAGLSYLVALQLQLDWGWPPALAALGMAPQVVVLIAGGLFVNPFVQRVGLERAGYLSAVAVVAGLAVYGALGRFGYGWVAISLALVAAGLRVVGVVAAVNVMRGLPENRTTIGAALTDTVTQVSSGTGVAVAGTVLAAIFAGSLTASGWTTAQTGQFHLAVTVAGLTLTAMAAALVGWGFLRTRAVNTIATQPTAP
ncbi:MFS transporter [Mycobacterium sp. MS1601]|uniref:MFS transporter n=1 Tax=Mycobacterium sp. MS1601 TaxID=1936029 RepID=UPI001F258108|nr:MFS transporter [Mycobacterium sp. MS1601]